MELLWLIPGQSLEGSRECGSQVVVCDCDLADVWIAIDGEDHHSRHQIRHVVIPKLYFVDIEHHWKYAGNGLQSLLIKLNVFESQLGTTRIRIVIVVGKDDGRSLILNAEILEYVLHQFSRPLLLLLLIGNKLLRLLDLGELQAFEKFRRDVSLSCPIGIVPDSLNPERPMVEKSNIETLLLHLGVVLLILVNFGELVGIITIRVRPQTVVISRLHTVVGCVHLLNVVRPLLDTLLIVC